MGCRVHVICESEEGKRHRPSWDPPRRLSCGFVKGGKSMARQLAGPRSAPTQGSRKLTRLAWPACACGTLRSCCAAALNKRMPFKPAHPLQLGQHALALPVLALAPHRLEAGVAKHGGKHAEEGHRKPVHAALACRGRGGGGGEHRRVVSGACYHAEGDACAMRWHRRCLHVGWDCQGQRSREQFTPMPGCPAANCPAAHCPTDCRQLLTLDFTARQREANVHHRALHSAVIVLR